MAYNLKNYNEIISDLTSGQKDFIDFCISGQNVALTGGAGTGKSYVVEKLIDALRSSGAKVGVTSTTGISALTIKGSTLHSFCGIGLGKGGVDYLLKGVRRNRKAKDRIKGIKILFIDEVSMLKGGLMDDINEIFKKVRGNKKPFGGVQVICSFDILQLPPIFDDEEERIYAFESKSWKELEFQYVNLTEVVRQKDKKFAELLENIRFGREFDEGLLNSRLGKKPPKDETPIHLYPTNKMVDKKNKWELSAIKEKEVIFWAKDSGNEYQVKNLDKICPAPNRLALKVGAQVMLLKNIDLDLELCNGSIGVVREIHEDGVEVEFKSGIFFIETDKWEITEQEIINGEVVMKPVAARKQIPLKLAWAMSIHKSQSATLDCAVAYLAGCFEDGQVYVALSRLKSLDGLYLGSFNREKIKVNEKAVRFLKKITDGEDSNGNK